MKIGILTYHRAENYGALLQAFATMTYLKSLGNKVSFVDYWPTYHSDYFKLFSWKKFFSGSIRTKMAMIIGILIWGIPRVIRKKRLQHFMHEYLSLSPQPRYTHSTDTTEQYDVVIYGSDQIWRKQHLGGVEFDDWYYGSVNVLANRKVAYAASMGKEETSDKEDEYVRRMMGNFAHIAVREGSLQEHLFKIGVTSTVVVDPVFLLTKEQWLQLAEPSEKHGDYILFYNLLNSQQSTRFAKALSQHTGLPIIEVTKRLSLVHGGNDCIRTASVERFLGLLAGARYVVSNSFHGVAISLLFGKEFWAVGMGDKADRVTSLLASIGLSQHYVETTFQDSLLKKSIDYLQVCRQLDQLIFSSKEYLKTSIQS
jgi:hypothetical protein